MATVLVFQMADKKRLTLREINAEIESIVFDTPYDEDSEAEVEARLNELNLAFDEKLENLGQVRLEQKAYIQRLDDEIKRLQVEKRSVERRGAWLDFYAMTEMLKIGIRSFKGKFLKLSIRKSPVSAQVAIDPDNGQPHVADIDERFWEEEVRYKVLKSDAIRHFKETGEVPEGFTIIDNREHLRIG